MAAQAGRAQSLFSFLIASNGGEKTFSQLLRPPATFACVCLKKMEVNETKLVPAAEIHTQQEPEVLVSVTFA